MQSSLNQLVFSLFKKNNLHECTLEELKSFTTQYPYYSTVHFLYTAKLKEYGNKEYINELQKTSLYFTNPLWLDLLLSKQDEELLIPVEEIKHSSIPFEDSNNDELVFINPRPEIFSELPVVKKSDPVQLEIPVQEKKEPDLLFEPYHTVDYFASQGIKPVLDDKPKDRFGQQLKSFTEWLKLLKTTPAQQISQQTEKIAEENVTTLAVHSIEDRNVETEAMAEVWIKQGQAEKAIAIYHKLSLLNPSKSSYFASLIEKLKTN